MPLCVLSPHGQWDDDDHGPRLTRCECAAGTIECPDCEGTGHHDASEWEVAGCALCLSAANADVGDCRFPPRHRCPTCGGTGYVQCPRCRGTGEREVTPEDYEAAHEARERSER